jgi:Protein of unknown function (DUF3383)
MSATINTIPASQDVNVIPAVLSAGGAALNFVELMLTANTRVPIGAALSFPSATAVGSYFGQTSNEYNEATVYFGGFTGANQTPGNLLMAQYPTSNVGAYLRGGNLSTLTLIALQAIAGVLTVTIDGTPHTSSAINLSAATSFSNAAELITDALGLTGPTQATITTASMGASFTANAGSPSTHLVVTSVTGLISVGDVVTATGISGTATILSQVSGTTGGAGTYVLSESNTCSSASATSTSIVLDVTSVASGTIAIGQQLEGSGVTAGTFITALGTGTGGTGTYVTTQTQSVASEAMTTVTPVVTWDSVSGGFVVISSTTGASSTISFGSGTIAAPLLLTQATGAVTSQGAAAATPAAFMNAIVALTQNWVTFQTLFDPDNGSGNTQKLAFAAWANSVGNGVRYIYLCTDTDITPTESVPATSSLGYILQQNASSGTVPIWQPAGAALHHAAFVGGAIAAIDFTETNGRTNLKFRTQSGLAASVTNQTIAQNLGGNPQTGTKGNGYNYVGAMGTATSVFTYFQQGMVTGPFSWIDALVDEIWINNGLQADLMLCLTQNKAIPYNPRGYGLMRQYMMNTINAALNFAAIVNGVPLSTGEAAQVNNAAGKQIDGTITQQGWYLQILPAQASIRGNRQSPPINFWYTDGGSVNCISLVSTDIQ